jgi:hypothetical protein
MEYGSRWQFVMEKTLDRLFEEKDPSLPGIILSPFTFAKYYADSFKQLEVGNPEDARDWDELEAVLEPREKRP